MFFSFLTSVKLRIPYEIAIQLVRLNFFRKKKINQISHLWMGLKIHVPPPPFKGQGSPAPDTGGRVVARYGGAGEG